MEYHPQPHAGLGKPAFVFDRITFDSDRLGGLACIRGMRISVASIIGHIACGATPDEVIGEYPYLEKEDIFQALAYSAWLAREETFPFS